MSEYVNQNQNPKDTAKSNSVPKSQAKNESRPQKASQPITESPSIDDMNSIRRIIIQDRIANPSLPMRSSAIKAGLLQRKALQRQANQEKAELLRKIPKRFSRHVKLPGSETIHPKLESLQTGVRITMKLERKDITTTLQ